MVSKPAALWISELALRPHPEGGYYRETYRSRGDIIQDSLPEGMQGKRSYATSIYYLLEAGDVSRFHRIRSDELWFYHSGGPIEIILVNSDAEIQVITLGPETDQGQSFQVCVPAECWFGARIPPSFAGYALVSCVVAPGFDFQDFELASPEDVEKWPSMRLSPELCPPLH